MPTSPYNKPAVRRDEPPYRKLRAYAFDPSLSVKLDMVGINEIIYKVPWETLQHKAPIGEYIEVIDHDPSSDCFYEPVNLDDPFILAQDGVNPSEGNPQFHQQMVYAVCMTTIRNFEKALGRWVFWSGYREHPSTPGVEASEPTEEFIQRLRVYPHALRAANAYYSPRKKALLFGYFPAFGKGTAQFPGGLVFTCLSHDIIAHETTHALLDGLHRRYIEPSNPDCLAFHEAFADIVALFQHFTFPEVLFHQIAKTRGDLASQNLLGELAQQFGQSIGKYGSLRSALGYTDEKNVWHAATPNPMDYQTVAQPHPRGSILVGAVFDAFLAIYKRRIADLLRIATNGSGILPDGELHPDLVRRLAKEAAKSAGHVLNMCVRALDYCPPVDITFGEFLRAVITADFDLVPADEKGYRVAFTEAFRQRGIFPGGIRTLSPDSLRWDIVPDYGDKEIGFSLLAGYLRDVVETHKYLPNREEAFKASSSIRARLHTRLQEKFDSSPTFKSITGLMLEPDPTIWKNIQGTPAFEVHSFRAAQRVGPNGQLLNQAIVSITQKRIIERENGRTFVFRGGCTLILDLMDMKLRYAISKNINDTARIERQEDYMFERPDLSLRATYFGDPNERSDEQEKFALLHS